VGPHCVANPLCLPQSEADCQNTLDDDADGATDCDDIDCDNDPVCTTQEETPVIPDTETNCSDGIDDDQDSTVDCGDNDCVNNADCIIPPDFSGSSGNDGDGGCGCQFGTTNKSSLPMSILFFVVMMGSLVWMRKNRKYD